MDKVKIIANIYKKVSLNPWFKQSTELSREFMVFCATNKLVWLGRIASMILWGSQGSKSYFLWFYKL